MPQAVIGPSTPDASPPSPADQVRSILFTPEEMVSVHKAVTAYINMKSGQGTEKGNEAETFLKQLEDSGKATPENLVEEKFYAYPQFYMESLIYHTMDDWNIRVNNQLLNKNMLQTKDGLKVLLVDADKAILEWHPANMARVKETWALVPNNAVTVDFTKGTVTFALRSGQTFSSYVMRVLEGKVRPMVTNAPAVIPPPPDKAPDKPPAPVEKPSDSSKEGLNGLIGEYQQLQKGPAQ